ncbi:MAG: minichromosome maintenance protein MCM [Candidatus Aenigmarchaeota archaeon]|nr:minichromosome maintenance protein MCM [Candidatus Aenigmarchaeota archaeon]
MEENRENILLEEKAEEFLRSDMKALIEACQTGAVVIDFVRLDRFDPILSEMLLDQPEMVLKIFQNAIDRIELPEHEKINVRVRNLPKHRKIRIRRLRAEHIGKLVEIEGVVRAASEIRPQIYEAVFRCPECKAKIIVDQDGNVLKQPIICPECGRRGIFKLIEKRMYDTRWITINEPFEITQGEPPEKINVLLKEDLTSPGFQRRTDPGNELRIVGILKEIPKKIGGKLSTRPDIYFEANYAEPREESFEEIKITDEDKERIMELAKDPNIYKKLIDSIAPGIYGHDEIKEAILLQLFGGVRREYEDGTHIRGNIHILITGDPSTAKSQLISLAVKALPRGRYVSGKGVTGAGLTTTVVKNEMMGSWVLEAGALILSNNSILAIDEFDKMSKDDQVAMHEAMSLETVSVAKANIVASLPARTAILAAANPKLGRFDTFVPILKQIQIPETLLTRFDLKFALKDIPDAKRDQELVDHVTRSRIKPETLKPPLDLHFLRKYIVYARKTCTDIKMTEEAAEMLKKFYVDLRNKYYSGEGTPTVPITLRQFEALMRLSEASAKVRLDKYVRKEDSERAIRLMKFSLQQLGIDMETGKIDIDKIESGITTSQRSKIRVILEIIDELAKEMDSKNVSIEDVKAAAEEKGITDVDEVLDRLKNDGLIFQPKPGYVRKV